jgi:hypothetical protein
MKEYFIKNWVGLVIIGSIIGYILYYLYDRKCSFCGKFGVLKKIDKELIGQKASKIKETINTKDSKGRIIRSREVMIPATTKTFRIYYECKNCKKQETRLETNTYKN